MSEPMAWPVPKPKVYHRASKINQRGGVSALCFKRPRAINLAVASWTLLDADVTCPRCRKILATVPSEAPE